jgi:predicted NBD/HSP70 family sugar kinase
LAEGNSRARDYSSAVALGMKPATVRLANQRAVLTIIAREPGLSNADIARRSELAPQTVSAVLDDLEAFGLLRRGPVLRGRRGQPATPVFIDGSGAYAVGVEVGWKHLEVVLISLGGDILALHREAYGYPDALSVFEIVGRHVGEMLRGLSAAERARMVGVGLAAPGGIGDPVYLSKPPGNQQALWAGVDIEDHIARATGLPTELVNDGNAACWAEYGAFKAPRPKSLAFLLIDTFVAAGIIAEGRLWQGVTGASANLGSMLVTDRRGASRFGHQVASLFTLRQQLEGAGLRFEAAFDDAPGEAAAAIVTEWVEDTGYTMAQIFLNTATVLEYEYGVLEAAVPGPLRERLLEATRRHMGQMPTLGHGLPKIEPGHLGRSGAALGAAQLRLYRRYFSRELEHMETER